MRQNKRKRPRTLTYREVSNASFLQQMIRQANGAKVTIAFHQNGKLVNHIDEYNLPEEHGAIIRWLDGRYYFHPYKVKRAKLYTMTLAKFKYLKSILA